MGEHRSGGHESLWVMVTFGPETTESDTGRRHLGDAAMEDPEVGLLHVGASIGVTPIEPSDDPSAVMRRADDLAYEAKRAGGGIRHR